MLRTTIIRSNFLKESAKKVLRNNVTRVITVECSKRRYHNRKVTLLKTHPQKWQDTIVRYYAANLPPHTKVPLPALSPTMETGNIVSWAKKEGDKLSEGDLLAEIETDKATMGFETPEEGFLAKILIPAGSKGVPIGKLVCIIVPNQADVAKFKDFKDTSPAVAPAKPGAAPPAPTPAVAAPPPPPAPRAGSPPPTAAAAAAVAATGGRVYVSPMARRLAEQRNIRLQGKGTGLYESITSGDLDKLGADAAPSPPVRAPPSPRSRTPSPSRGRSPSPSRGRSPSPKRGGAPKIPPGAAYVDIPITNMRNVIAKRLSQSKQQVPHYYESIDVSADKILEVRAKYNQKLERRDIRISVNDFVVKASAMALMKVPEVNSQWLDSVIRQYKHADISIAVATDAGLITPIVFEADRKGLIEINKEVKDLVGKARKGKLQPHQFQGGTFTISNLGMFGIAHFTAIINAPQCSILAVGTTRKRLVADKECEKGFRTEQFMTFTLSSDHRVIDGAVAARWLLALKEHLEDPVSMIM